MKKIRDAVSIVFECHGEIFTIVRQNFLRNFPGYTAFIGGKVDSEDHAPTPYNLHLLDDHPVHLINALVREVKEEVGIELDRLIEQGFITAVDYIGRALTPEFNPYRFNTHFFRIAFKQKPSFRVDENEVMRSKWSTPTEVLEHWKTGGSMMVPPVRFFIEALEKDIYFKQELTFENRFDLDKIVPWIEPIVGLVQVMPLSNTVPPAQRTNAFLIGEGKKVLIDPSPKSKDELNKFFETIKDYSLEKIFITHHHKDHHQFAVEIALAKKISIEMSSFTFNKIKKVYGDDYFKDISVNLLSEGDVLTHWNGEKVLVVEVPGHDEGQLAIMPESKNWFLAGDLFQGVGTVVIGGEEGCMTKYMQTLQKVINLAPRCVIPSHGIALGGTYIIEKTLEHRKFREEQVLEMHQEGLSEDEMIKRIYFNIPENILKYARANIQSHLKKLKDENRLKFLSS